MRARRPSLSAAGLAAGAALSAACSVPGPSADAGRIEPMAGLRVLVRTSDAMPAAEAIARAASEAARVPVDYVAAAGSRWHALRLRCDSDAACERAFEQLVRSRPPPIEVVERDARRRPA